MKVLKIQAVSERTGVPVATLRYWRHVGDIGPKSFKLGPKLVAYREEDVEAWLQEQYAATSTK